MQLAARYTVQRDETARVTDYDAGNKRLSMEQTDTETVWSAGEKVGPLTVREPVYRVDVRLDAQYVAAGEQKLPLRSGMMVNADILQEKRKVWEWVFEPILSLKQRMS